MNPSMQTEGEGTTPPPDSAPLVVSAAEYTSRLRVVLRKSSAGGPTRRTDRWILLRAIAASFAEGEVLNEKAFTARIQDFLLGPGRHLGTDAINLRRALIDEGFADRDGYGREYRRSRRHERRVRFEEGLPETSAVTGDI
jgi:hypothetical protein